MQIKIINDYNSAEFNAKAHHPLQSWEWGEARQKTGIDIVRLMADENVFTMTLHPIPYTSYRIGYIPRSVSPSQELLDFLTEWGKKNHLIFIKFEPYIELSEKNNWKLEIEDWKFNRSPHPLFPDWTQMLDLTLSEDELLKNMKPKTRYNTRLAEKKGVVVREVSTDEGFEVFLKLYFETCKRQHYFGHSEEYHRHIWNTLKGSMAHILIAYYEDIPLCAYELFLFNNRWYYPYGGSSEQERNVMAPNLLMWEAIKLGKKLGAETFDMWGSLPSTYDQADPWSGFTRFKEGYGTKFVEFIGSYDLIVNPILYQTYNVVHALRRMLLKM